MWSLEESHCQGDPHLKRIAEPALVIQSTGDTGVFPSDAQGIYDVLASTDKELHMMTGDHYLETPHGARDVVADMIVDWLRKHDT
jgi:esterase/lipase